jgi:H+/Cl- antiporter ClcA
MAGVIFAMEVILMEYTIVGFIPVIVASALGAVISQLVFGSDISFDVDTRIGVEVAVIPYMLVAGLIFGIAAVAFTQLHMLFFRLHCYSLLLRFTVIGVVTGLIAVFVPEIMRTGYDTLADALNGVLTLEILLLVVLAKLAVTALATGLGMFGGLIGPSLVIGGCLGGALGLIGGDLMPVAIDPKFSVLLGMVAMMGAVLNAPMAALVATLELSHSPEMIFPSMLTVVVACLTLKQRFGSEGVFTEQLRHQGHDILSDHGKGFLSRVGVASVEIDSLASLHEASNRLRSAEAEALVVVPVIKSEAKPVLGVITKTNILNYYGM